MLFRFYLWKCIISVSVTDSHALFVLVHHIKSQWNVWRLFFICKQQPKHSPRNKLQLPCNTAFHWYCCLDQLSLVASQNSCFWWAYWSQCLVIPYRNVTLANNVPGESLCMGKKELFLFYDSTLNVFFCHPLTILSSVICFTCAFCSLLNTGWRHI